MNLSNTIAQTIFWLSAAALGYTYVGYPLLLLIAARLRTRPVRRAAFEPVVTVIITAYNEERDLAAKLENTLALSYPKDKLEIIVASDCSSDRTDDIVRSFAARGVRLHRQRNDSARPPQKPPSNSRAARSFFSLDATTLYQPDVLRVMMPDLRTRRSAASPVVSLR